MGTFIPRRKNVWSRQKLAALDTLVNSDATFSEICKAFPERKWLGIICKIREKVEMFPKEMEDVYAFFDYGDQTKGYSDLYKNRFQPWEPKDDEELKRLFENGSTINSLMVHFQRSMAAITKRLEHVYERPSEKERMYQDTKRKMRFKKIVSAADAEKEV